MGDQCSLSFHHGNKRGAYLLELFGLICFYVVELYWDVKSKGIGGRSMVQTIKKVQDSMITLKY
jgi:hypothetical protein